MNASRFIPALVLTWLWVSLASAQWPVSHPQIETFANPPLRYRGPDPTANVFLPATVDLDQLPAESFLQYPQDAYLETLPSPEDSAAEPIEAYLLPPTTTLAPYEHVESAIRSHKEGFFQKAAFIATWIDRNNKVDDFGLTELHSYATFAVPFPKREWPLLISPSFGVYFLHGPKTTDLPPRLYESYASFLWLPKIRPNLLGILEVTPTYNGDFDADTEDAFRFKGKALVRYDWSPERLQLAFGVLFPNRNDVRWLPAGGVFWMPTPNQRHEILFPKPKFAYRFAQGSLFEDWAYLGGEFGGDSFAVRRLSGVSEVITLRDFRVYLGLERKRDGGAGFFLEIGYVVGRVIEFEFGQPDIEADSNAMLRGGVFF